MFQVIRDYFRRKRTVSSITSNLYSLVEKLNGHADHHDETVQRHDERISMIERKKAFSAAEANAARRIAGNITNVLEGDLAAT